MKFESLELYNWRPFLGSQRVEFSTDPERPLTLLLGPNGAGKTALLNAFTWALYEDFTEGFDHRDRLVNLEALAADPSAEVWVEVQLQHDDDEFTVRRTTDGHRQASGSCDVTVKKNGERAVVDDIYRILPPSLKELFFIPAESFSTAQVLKGGGAGEETFFDVGRAIRALLSGDIYENASADIRKAMDSSGLKPPMNYRDHTIDAALKEYEQARAELDDAEQRRANLPNQLKQATTDAARAKEEAERYDPEKIKEWEGKLKAHEKDVEIANRHVDAAHELYEQLANVAHMHLSRKGIASAIERLDAAEKMGLMPPRIHEQVLDRTLENLRCSLCGEALRPAARERVALLRERVRDSELAVRGLETRTRLKQYLKRHRSEVRHLHDDIASTATALRVSAPGPDDDIGQLQAVVRNCIDVAERVHREAEHALEAFTEGSEVERPSSGSSPLEIAMVRQKRVHELKSEMKDIDGRIELLTQRMNDALRDYKKKSEKSKEHARKSRAIAVLQEAKSYFDEAMKGLEEFGRRDFEVAINRTFSDLVAKSFTIRVDKDFSLDVLEAESAERIPLAQSEKILLLIAFLGAIARLAPHYERIARNKEQLKRTGEVDTSSRVGFPVVLDSPISPLDDEYEGEVVRALPELLPQVIVPVSAKSVRVWEGIASSVGKAYVMELTSDSASDRHVRWAGKDYQYSVQDNGVVPARTQLVELRSLKE